MDQKKLQLVFRDAAEVKTTMTLSDIREGLDASAVQAASQKMVDAGVLLTKDAVVTALVSAKEITTTARSIIEG